MTLFLLVACKNEAEKTSEDMSFDQNAKFIEKIEYSNLVDDDTKEEVQKSLVEAGLNAENVDAFLSEVDNYNTTVADVGLVKEGFNATDNLMPIYDVEKIDQNWFAKNPEFIGYDCRMTAFLLLGDLITVENPSEELSPKLFMDNDAIEFSNNSYFTDEKIKEFNTLFAGIPAELTKDIAKHVEEVKNHFEKSKIVFAENTASLISVYMHDDLDNELFVGHTGVLVPSVKGDYLLFIEKLSFQEPYQLLKFNNRQELNDYLMNKYDNWIAPETARAFIMENGELLNGYRLNPNLEESK